ncbi:Uncharacterised protein [Vibrio cholerae]|nr:Uncharacterised protein [Vibrio cholerae]
MRKQTWVSTLFRQNFFQTRINKQENLFSFQGRSSCSSYRLLNVFPYCTLVVTCLVVLL